MHISTVVRKSRDDYSAPWLQPVASTSRQGSAVEVTSVAHKTKLQESLARRKGRKPPQKRIPLKPQNVEESSGSDDEISLVNSSDSFSELGESPDEQESGSDDEDAGQSACQLKIGDFAEFDVTLYSTPRENDSRKLAIGRALSDFSSETPIITVELMRQSSKNAEVWIFPAEKQLHSLPASRVLRKKEVKSERRGQFIFQ